MVPIATRISLKLSMFSYVPTKCWTFWSSLQCLLHFSPSFIQSKNIRYRAQVMKLLIVCFFHPPVTSFHLYPNIPLATVFSSVLSRYSSLMAMVQLSSSEVGLSAMWTASSERLSVAQYTLFHELLWVFVCVQRTKYVKRAYADGGRHVGRRSLRMRLLRKYWIDFGKIWY